MCFEAMCVRSLVLVLLLVAARVVHGASDLEYELTKESCQLKSNSTLKQQFQQSVRLLYPNTTSKLQGRAIFSPCNSFILLQGVTESVM